MTQTTAEQAWTRSRGVWLAHIGWRVLFLLCFWLSVFLGPESGRNFPIAVAVFGVVSLGPVLALFVTTVGFALYRKKNRVVRLLAIASSVLQIPVSLAWVAFVLDGRAVGDAETGTPAGYVLLLAYPTVSIVLDALFVIWATKARPVFLAGAPG